MTRKPAALLLVLSLAVLALVLIPAAGIAAKGGNSENPSRGGGKGGGGGGGGGGDAGTLSVVMVMDENGNGAPNWNDEVTFDVSTTATDRPWVRLDCYQAGVWVLTSNAGYFDMYPWAPNFTLASGAWTSGAGNCVASLYMVTSNGRSKTLATMGFDVDQ